jgi:hypothetical protein
LARAVDALAAAVWGHFQPVSGHLDKAEIAVPRSLADLQTHDGIQVDLASSSRSIAWLFRESG